MKVIFLDIDGVLNGHRQTESGYCSIDKRMASRLNRILRATDANLVISSAWRYMVLMGSMTLRGFEHLLQSHGVDCHRRVIGVTEIDHDIWERGDQIVMWLRGHPEVTRYLVIDDLDIGIKRCGLRFLRTWGRIGLNGADARAAIRILNGEGNA